MWANLKRSAGHVNKSSQWAWTGAGCKYHLWLRKEFKMSWAQCGEARSKYCLISIHQMNSGRIEKFQEAHFYLQMQDSTRSLDFNWKDLEVFFENPNQLMTEKGSNTLDPNPQLEKTLVLLRTGRTLRLKLSLVPTDITHTIWSLTHYRMATFQISRIIYPLTLIFAEASGGLQGYTLC